MLERTALAASVLLPDLVALAQGTHPVTGRQIAPVMSHVGADWLDRPERDDRESRQDAGQRRFSFRPFDNLPIDPGQMEGKEYGHRPDGGGLVGPNLCDDYWIHGSNYVDNVKAYTQKERVRNRYTGQDEEPDERLMRSIEDKIDWILDTLSRLGARQFGELLAAFPSRGEKIVTFLALLEMIRLKLVRVYQTGAFGDIRIYKRALTAEEVAARFKAPSPSVTDLQPANGAVGVATGASVTFSIADDQEAVELHDGAHDDGVRREWPDDSREHCHS